MSAQQAPSLVPSNRFSLRMRLERSALPSTIPATFRVVPPSSSPTEVRTLRSPSTPSPKLRAGSLATSLELASSPAAWLASIRLPVTCSSRLRELASRPSRQPPRSHHPHPPPPPPSLSLARLRSWAPAHLALLVSSSVV